MQEVSAINNNIQAPVLGLPEGMSVEQAHVLAAQQNAAEMPAPVLTEAEMKAQNPNLITSADIPQSTEISIVPAEAAATVEQSIKKTRMARFLGKLGIGKN